MRGISCLKFSRDGQFLYVGSEDGSLSVFADPKARRLLLKYSITKAAILGPSLWVIHISLNDIYVYTYICIYVYIYAYVWFHWIVWRYTYISFRMNKWVNEWMSEWMSKCMYGWIEWSRMEWNCCEKAIVRFIPFLCSCFTTAFQRVKYTSISYL